MKMTTDSTYPFTFRIDDRVRTTVDGIRIVEGVVEKPFPGDDRKDLVWAAENTPTVVTQPLRRPGFGELPRDRARAFLRITFGSVQDGVRDGVAAFAPPENVAKLYAKAFQKLWDDTPDYPGTDFFEGWK